MLRNMLADPKAMRSFAWILTVEMEDGVDLEAVELKLAEGPMWMEGVGSIDVDLLGELEPEEDGVSVVENTAYEQGYEEGYKAGKDDVMKTWIES